MSGLTAIRAGWGVALLIAPDAILHRLPHQPSDPPVRAFARVLGARDLAQATIVNHWPTRRAILTGAAVDATHATSMLALALLMPQHRALALTNAATASAFAAAGLLAARH